MDQHTRNKLRSERPEYFDATENKNAIIPERRLKAMLSGAYKQGLKMGSLIALLAFAFTTTLAIVSSGGFSDRFGLSSAVWEAIFIVAAFLSWILFFAVLILTIKDWYNFGFWGSADTSEIFNNENGISMTQKRHSREMPASTKAKLADRNSGKNSNAPV